MEQWNGRAFLCPPHKLPVVKLASDASGSRDCGTWHDNGCSRFPGMRKCCQEAASNYPGLQSVGSCLAGVPSYDGSPPVKIK